ncbi:hypothetical protein FRC14_005051 [Serendipita sp. 396]|nr:hypothetical protein FRC14_005051 [Serendipita sp. 396]KAG8802773.1 hypothetical protein FRC16_008689 [Serendipita sp. 398]KAG8873093.1 hypothetical protein FRC20_008720 [Serendipita sp. 405]
MKFPVLLVAVSASFFAQSVVADVVHIAREEVGIVPRVPAVYYPTTTTTTQKSVSTVKPSTSTSASECVAPIWGQCGGLWWTGCTKCPPDWVCTWLNDFYSQCLLKSSSSSTTSKVTSTSSTSKPTSTRSIY